MCAGPHSSEEGIVRGRDMPGIESELPSVRSRDHDELKASQYIDDALVEQRIIAFRAPWKFVLIFRQFYHSTAVQAGILSLAR